MSAQQSWLSSSIIYQLFLGRWQSASLLHHPCSVLSQLTVLPLSRLLDVGIDCIYLFGLFDNRSPIIVNQESGRDLTNISKRLPSPFAVTDHRSPNPLLGSLADLHRLISHLHRCGFRIILDFIPNHTATTHPWTHTHPEFYHRTNQDWVYQFSGDVIQLNYHNHQLRREMIHTLSTVADWGVDGVRCDMTHLIPMDFWFEAISEIKSHHPDFVFIAEAYSPSLFSLDYISQHLQAGFDAIYHEPFYRNLVQVFNHHQPINFLIDHLNFITHQPYHSNLINYLANHDDPIPENVIPLFEAVFGLSLFLPGTPFIYNGLLNGLTDRLAHHYFEPLPESWIEYHHLPPHLANLLRFRHQFQPRLHQLQISNSNLLIGQLSSSSAALTFYANLSTTPQLLPVKSKTNGLLRSLTSSDQLFPGQIEIVYD